MASMEKGESQELNLILKGDVSGSVEALEDALAKIDVGDEVSLRVIDRGVGAITETNVDLAAASDAIIIGFNVRPQGKATELADREGVEIRYYTVIYQAIDEIEAALKGMLKPEFEESTLGQAEIRAIFRSSKIGNIAGCMVIDGVIRRNAKVRVIRDGAVVADNLDLASLKREKDDAVRGPRGLRVWSGAARTSRTSRRATSSRPSRCGRSRAADHVELRRAMPSTAVASRLTAFAVARGAESTQPCEPINGESSNEQPACPQDRRPDPGDRGRDAGAADQGPAAGLRDDHRRPRHR